MDLEGHEINRNMENVIIRCPECGEVQPATILPTIPWNTFIHDCEKCDYIIMESEWDQIDEL